jgi:uncharacterized protein (DUF1499 family)
MSDRSTIVVAPLARWSSRGAIFSVSLIVLGVALHRISSLPTMVALNLFAVGAAGAALSALIGLMSLVGIWRRGYAGAGSAAVGILLPLAAAAWPLTFLPAFLNLPRINDIATDTAAPPRFAALAKQRTGDANPPEYAGARVAEEQQKIYPDLRTFVLDRSAEEAFELVEEAVRKLKWKVVATDPPASKPVKAGALEATDVTPLVGFTDDITIRVEGAGARTRVDVRSASRYGKADFGQNAQRVRRFLAELQVQVDSTAPIGVAGARSLRASRARALVKKVKERDPQKAESRSKRARAQSNAQRARGQKETLR